MALRDYLLLEKVTKAEIDSILRNDRLQVGVEFEFVLPQFLEKYADDIKRWETLSNYETDLHEYEEALEEWEEKLENDEDVEPPTPPAWAIELGAEPGEEIADPDQYFPELVQDTKKSFKNLIDGFLPLDKLPFSNYQVTPEASKSSKNKWLIKPDGSLGPAGVEMVTPILSMPEFIKICPKVFEYIEKYGEVNEDCGLHISMSIKGVKKLGDVLDVVKLSLFTDEGYIYKYFDMRKYNQYAKSAHSAIRLSGGVNKEKMNEFIKVKKMKVDYSDSHDMAINIEHLETKNEYIEFRYLGGQNYHRKWDRIKNIVAQYGYNLLLACDPEYKKREYLLKLHNVMLKADLFSDMIDISQLDKNSREYQEAYKRITLLNKRIKLSTDELADFAHSVGSDVLEKMDDSLF